MMTDRSPASSLAAFVVPLLLLSVLAPCAAPASTWDCSVVVSVEEAGSLGSVGWTLDYGATGGQVVGTGNSPSCTKLIDGALAAFTDFDLAKRLKGGLVVTPPFSTPSDLASCAFTASSPPSVEDFVVEVDDASDGDGEVLDPLPDVFVSSVGCEQVTTTTTTTTTTLPRQCQDWTATFTLDSASAKVGSILLTVDYGDSAGNFSGNGSDVACASLVDGAEFAAQDEPSDSTLVLGLVTLEGIAEGTPLLACTFRSAAFAEPLPGDFTILVSDASDLEVQPVDVSVGMALEPSGAVKICASECGDGYVDADEECDDGNGTGNDACTNSCRNPICGDGIVRAGEEQCDDANSVDTDACRSDCRWGVCGDGVVRPATEDCDDGNTSNLDDCLSDCRVAFCGDGLVRAGFEECDDRNSSNLDGCVDGCRMATCGDGFVRSGVEQCDDGNTAQDDACLESCHLAKCGDGIVRTGVETCDDGNTSNTDDCVQGCKAARCGDGYVETGIEECDNGRTAGIEGCTPDCRLAALCGDANGDRGVTAADALRMMQRAVSLDVECPDWTCDINGDQTVTATDALLGLRKAVHLPVALTCSEPAWLVLRMTTPAPLGALNVTVDFADAAATIPGLGSDVQCEGLVPGAIFVFHQPEAGRLTAGMVSVDGASSPRNIARCVLEVSDAVRTSDFVVTVNEANAPAEPFATVPGVQVKAIPY